MKNLFAALFALLLPVLASAQFSISGKVTDKKGGSLSGATVKIDNSTIGVAVDLSGNYKIENLKPGNYGVTVSYIGFESQHKKVSLSANSRADFTLFDQLYIDEEVSITATRASYKTPITFKNVTQQDIAKNNSGRGFEYLLEQTPSAVVSSKV